MEVTPKTAHPLGGLGPLVGCFYIFIWGKTKVPNKIIVISGMYDL